MQRNYETTNAQRWAIQRNYMVCSLKGMKRLLKFCLTYADKTITEKQTKDLTDIISRVSNALEEYERINTFKKFVEEVDAQNDNI